MASDTKARIRAAALELFGAQGVQRTSLRQIADRLGITKPALYYHFESREALIRSLLQEVLDEGEALLRKLEAATDRAPSTVLGAYFDLMYRHRHVTTALLRDPTALAELDIGDEVIAWRQRIITLIVGENATLEARTRAVVAVGGLADSTVVFADAPAEPLRGAALSAALAALDPDHHPG